jgi:uncharacterized membrane protein HdeD (DUF308 family)
VRRNDVDPISVVGGVAFLAVGLAALVDQRLDATALRWVWPVVLIVGGIALLARSRPR